ncbi:MAG: F0F1 ATP synthase subunit B [Acidobacteria bacterium]|jgi:F-type H+-transporting ATPase subunit b|nr:F0F1 ATP synthase subunit B [Acidobacteriota bacterium]
MPLTTMALLASAEASGGNPLLKVDPGLALWTLIIFLLLLFVLWRYGWGMMIGKLDARDRAIRGSIEEARAERLEAEKLLVEQKALLDKTRREAAAMLQAAQQDAGTERQRLVDQAREEYERILARGREQIDQETRAAVAEVRKVVADLAVGVAGRLIDRNLDTPGQRELAEKFVGELERKGGAEA